MAMPSSTHFSSGSGSFDFSSLKKQLLAHNDHFDSMVNMIPSQVYNASATNLLSQGDESNPKYHKGTSKESKETKRARLKAEKIAKFENPETTVEATSRIRKRQEEELQKKKDDDVLMDGSTERIDSSSEEINDGSMSRIEQLRIKLRAKIAEKQLRHPTNTTSGEKEAGATSKRAARRAEKLKRIEVAKAKKAAGIGGKSNVIQRLSTKVDLPAVTSLETPTSSNKVTDDLAGIDFGTMAGFVNTPHYIDNKSLANLGKKKSLDRLLTEVETKRKRLKELKDSDDHTEREKASRMDWGDVLREASASTTTKTPNDPTLIKKALKRKAKQKASSAKSWEARTRQTEESISEKQKMRSHNIEKRKIGGTVAANLSKKRVVDAVDGDDKKDGAKRKRMGPHSVQNRPGFEGKKQEMINGGDSSKKEGGGKARGKSQ